MGKYDLTRIWKIQDMYLLVKGSK